MARKPKILKEQAEKKKVIDEIAQIVQQLRLKSDWINKINEPEIKEKYYKEGLEQGLTLDSINKAFSILETMSKCQLPSIDNSNNITEDDSINVIIKIGDENFNTTTYILTADNESMLNRMFGPTWLSPTNNEPVSIETPSNSSKLFTHILTYLEALRANQTNLCPNVKNLSYEEVALLKTDCEYFGLRRLLIAINVAFLFYETDIAERQKAAAAKLEKTSNQLRYLREEKIRIEKRLAELPQLILECEAREEEEKKERLEYQTKFTPSVGDEIMINVSGNYWTEYKVIEVDGVLMGDRGGSNRKRNI